MIDQNTKRKTNGFTLLEILMVVAGIAILAAIVTLEINPKRELAKARNQERESDVNTIRNALKEYSLDNQGQVPSGVTADLKDICQGNCTTDSSQVDVSVIVDYLAREKLPYDPDKADGDALTGYRVAVSAQGNYKVTAPSAENGETVAVGPDNITQYLLADYQGAAAAYSVRLLKASYEGAALTIRRDSDDNTKDIQFAGDDLNTSQINNFCGTSNCYVQTWHDQSGNDYDLTQSTSGQQPQIYDGSSVITENSKPVADFDGNDDYLGQPTGDNWQSIFAVASYTKSSSSFSNFDGLITGKDDSGADNGIGLIGEDGTDHVRISKSSWFDLGEFYFNGNLHDENSVFSRINTLSLLTGISSDSISGVNGLSIGRDRGRSNRSWGGKISEIVIFPSDQSSNRSDIESNINDYFNIY